MALCMAGSETNPYTAPRSTTSALPEPAEDASGSVRALRLAGMILTLFACVKAFGLATSVSAFLPRLASTGQDLTWPLLVGFLPTVAAFAIPLALGVGLLFGNVRYRKVAWIYTDVITVLGLISSAVFQTFGRTTMPKLYLVAGCSERLFFAAAISLLLVGHPKPVRVAAGAVLGAFYVVSVFGMSWVSRF
jgi:O-antigen/teichoic acid export membrane protein